MRKIRHVSGPRSRPVEKEDRMRAIIPTAVVAVAIATVPSMQASHTAQPSC